LYEWGFLALVIFLCWSRCKQDGDHRKKTRAFDAKARAFDATFTEELAQVSPQDKTVSNPPISGSYAGFTSEDYERVDAELEFGGAGLISGRGTDAIDGDEVVAVVVSEDGDHRRSTREHPYLAPFL
jgi:hypothetical protein